ncbi:MAG: single-stranded DNA-binding protein [Planctomycetes bacterium]|nr:single-stranded DNA-binding protein [Planctomycetota bacterium]
MATLNKVMLIGRLTDNPEVRSLPSGGNVVKFRFAVGRSKKNPTTGQWENDPNPLYIDCEAFARPDTKRDLVSLISNYAKKGDSLYLEGRLQLDQWEDKNGGGKRSKHKLVVDGVEFVGSKADGGGEGGGGGGGGGGRSYGGGKPAAGGGRPALPPPANDDDEYGHGGGSGGSDDPIPF